MGLFSKKPEYVLEDIELMNKGNPRTFLRPTDTEINEQKIGSSVRLHFILSKPVNNCRAERIWVTIVSSDGMNFIGKLESLPQFIKSLQMGDNITFSKLNIAQVMSKEKPKFDEQKYAIITKLAIEKKQINWLIRTDDLNNEQDSGWQLFFGDENDEYLSKPSNSTIISLKNVLNFEPLLEQVFSCSGNAYEYSNKTNSFIEVSDWEQPQ